MMKKLIFSALTLAVLFCLLPGIAAAADLLTVEADDLEFNTDGQSVLAVGHVLLSYRDITIKADRLSKEAAIIKASGHVYVTTETASLAAEEIEMNLETKAISAASLSGRIGDLNLSAASLTSVENGELILNDTVLTRCNLENPCYTLRAGRISISGNIVTLDRGWLVLKGLRVLPLPKIRLDFDRADTWPRINLGHGEDGFFASIRYPITLNEATNLILEGKIAAEDPLAVSAELAWHPDPRLTLTPWIAYSVADGVQFGLNSAWNMDEFWAALETGYGLDADLWTAALSFGGPRYEFAGGLLTLQGFLNGSLQGAVTGPLTAGAMVYWPLPASETGQGGLGLTIGGTWIGGSPELLAKVEVDWEQVISSDFSINTGLSYDLAGHDWLRAGFGFTKHWDCYYLSLGFDFASDALSVSGGIDF